MRRGCIYLYREQALMQMQQEKLVQEYQDKHAAVLLVVSGVGWIGSFRQRKRLRRRLRRGRCFLVWEGCGVERMMIKLTLNHLPAVVSLLSPQEEQNQY